MSNRQLSFLLVLHLFFCFYSNPGFAQDCSQAWTQKYPVPRWSAAAAYDSQRNRLVVFGGENSALVDTSTWEWDGLRWEMKSTTGPSARTGHQMVYDSARGVVVLFGGSLSDETWEWNGSTWTKREPVHRPAGRYAHSMAYDSSRHVTVLFGGGAGSFHAVTNETWEWDGTDWTLRDPASKPSPRNTAGMSFDAARGVTVMYGGYTGSGSNGETWEWDGTNWTLANPEHKPMAMDRRALAYDAARQVTVLFAYSYIGYDGRTPETWEWNGTDWTQRSATASPGPRDLPAMAYDSSTQRVLVIDGFDYAAGAYVSDVWSWDSAAGTWHENSAVPPARAYLGMTYDSDRNVTVLYGGYKPGSYYVPLGDTWEENGNSWVRRQPATSPPALSSHGLVYDSSRQVSVLFGGYTLSGFNGETWEWNGTDWSQKSPLHSPPSRSDLLMAYDAARQETVVFGGMSSEGVSLGDTWVYNGTDWVQKFPAHSPGARFYSAMAYDPQRQITVLYGGNFYPADYSAWEWNGNDWSEVPASPNPGDRDRPGMAYNSDLQRMVISGGGNATTWSWNGSSWINLGVGGIPSRYSAQMAYDTARHQALMFGGFAGSQTVAETWILDALDSDLDGTLDCADQCPNNPDKIAPGLCGCGSTDTDGDADGTPDCNDLCPADPLKIAPGPCGCGVGEIDSDGDGTFNCDDLCPFDALKVDGGVCGCGASEADADADGTPDCTDLCPADPFKVSLGSCGCGVGEIDGDGDGTFNCNDLCPSDPLKMSAGVCGCGVSEVDGDADGTPDCTDLCPSDPFKVNAGVCGCGVSDADLNGNTVLDCLDARISTVTPAAPKLKLKKKLVSVELTAAQGFRYVIKYRWLTGVKAKDKKLKPKTLVSAAPALLLKGAKIGLTLALSYHYLADGPMAYQSMESTETKLKVKKFPKK